MNIIFYIFYMNLDIKTILDSILKVKGDFKFSTFNDFVILESLNEIDTKDEKIVKFNSDKDRLNYYWDILFSRQGENVALLVKFVNSNIGDNICIWEDPKYKCCSPVQQKTGDRTIDIKPCGHTKSPKSRSFHLSWCRQEHLVSHLKSAFSQTYFKFINTKYRPNIGDIVFLPKTSLESLILHNKKMFFLAKMDKIWGISTQKKVNNKKIK